MNLLELIIFAVIFGVILDKCIIPGLETEKLLRKGRKIIKNTPPPPPLPENELLAYRKGGSQWVEYYAQPHSTRDWLRNFAALESANQIREWLKGEYLDIPGVRIAFTRDQVQFTGYFVSMSQPEDRTVKFYRELIGEYTIQTAFSVNHEHYVPPHITFEPEDLVWLYRATLSNLIDIHEEYLLKAYYMHDGVIYKDAEHYRRYTQWRNAGRS